MNLREEIKKTSFDPEKENMIIMNIHLLFEAAPNTFSKLEVAILLEILEIFDERLENSKASERVKFNRDDIKANLFFMMSKVVPLRNFLLTKTKFIKKIVSE